MPPPICEYSIEEVKQWLVPKGLCSAILEHPGWHAVDHHLCQAYTQILFECIADVAKSVLPIREERVCSVCSLPLGERGIYWCVCKTKLYCGITCQRADWKAHRSECDRMQALRYDCLSSPKDETFLKWIVGIPSTELLDDEQRMSLFIVAHAGPQWESLRTDEIRVKHFENLRGLIRKPDNSSTSLEASDVPILSAHPCKISWARGRTEWRCSRA